MAITTYRSRHAHACLTLPAMMLPPDRHVRMFPRNSHVRLSGSDGCCHWRWERFAHFDSEPPVRKCLCSGRGCSEEHPLERQTEDHSYDGKDLPKTSM